MADPAEHRTAVLQHHALDLALEALTERVVDREEEPGLRARLYEAPAGAVGESPVVVGPVNGVRRAGAASEVGRSPRGDQEGFPLLSCDLIDSQGHRRCGDV